MAAGLSEDVFPPLTLLLKVRKVADKYFKGNTGTYIFVGWTAFNFIHWQEPDRARSNCPTTNNLEVTQVFRKYKPSMTIRLGYHLESWEILPSSVSD